MSEQNGNSNFVKIVIYILVILFILGLAVIPYLK